MSGLLPRRPSVERPDSEPRVVGLEGRESEAVFSALSSDVARSILAELYRGPTTKSELADRVGTSIQNVNYHLDKLVRADLVGVVDQWYSEKGVEMDVFAPDHEPLFLMVGECGRQEGVHDAVGDRDARAVSRSGGD